MTTFFQNLYNLPLLQTENGRRLAFTGSMTVSAPIFGGLQSYRKLRGQDDFLADMLQVEVVIAVGTAITAFLFWQILTFKRESKKRGGTAGLLTAFCILPLPVFGWAFKNQLASHFSNSETDWFIDIFQSVWSATMAAIPIFSTKAIIAIPLSFAVGYCIARNTPKDQPA